MEKQIGSCCLRAQRGLFNTQFSAWTRFKVVVAGPVFNFILAWFVPFS